MGLVQMKQEKVTMKRSFLRQCLALLVVAGSGLGMQFAQAADEAPDASCDVCWLPGGYPELHAGRLAGASR